MSDYTLLDIPSVLTPPFKLKDIDHNCPCCDYAIWINMIVEDKSSIICDNCDHEIKFKIVKI